MFEEKNSHKFEPMPQKRGNQTATELNSHKFEAVEKVEKFPSPAPLERVPGAS